ncbi:MAG: NAD(P)-dependent oxidoreductase [Actinomycetota bacterium]
MKLKLFSTAPLKGEGLSFLESVADVTQDPWADHVPARFYDPKDLADRLRSLEPDILVVEVDAVTAEVFAACPKLIAVGACRGDPWNIDVAAATAAGVPVLRAPARNAEAVAEFALALALAVGRRVVAADADVRAGEWVVDGKIAYQRFLGSELSGRPVGVIGLGAVGRIFARMVSALGCPVLAYDPYAPPEAFEAGNAKPASLEEVLSQSDVVSLHAVVTPETRGLIGAEQLGWMRPGAIVINTARAQLMDQDALVSALESGKLGGAGLDHFVNEYIPPDHPLTRLPNVVLTEHIAGATVETISRQTRIIADGIASLLEGRQPEHLVNGDVWEHRRELAR